MKIFLSGFLSTETNAEKRTAALALALKNSAAVLAADAAGLSHQLAAGELLSREERLLLGSELAVVRLALQARMAYKEAKQGPLVRQFGSAPGKMTASLVAQAKDRLMAAVLRGVCREEVLLRSTAESKAAAERLLQGVHNIVEAIRAERENGEVREAALQSVFCICFKDCFGERDRPVFSQFRSLGRYVADVMVVSSGSHVTILEFKKNDAELDHAIVQASAYAVQYCMDNEEHVPHINLVAISVLSMHMRLGVIKFGLDWEKTIVSPRLEYGKVFSWSTPEMLELLFLHTQGYPLTPLEYPSTNVLKWYGREGEVE
ncbi:MAG: uncharacterized protein A8A55_2580 [Amphiamblys sp. WSBS2006]|nr:MAG: uncharacterized protein A8A55_2580 [Amphiamblys sp. WSBS2006]